MKKINKTLLGARNQDLQQIVTEARYLENLETQGKTPESVVKSAKESLGLSDNESVIAEWEAKFGAVNKLQKNFVDTNALTTRLKDDNLITDEEVAVLEGIESRIADEMVSIFGLDLEDLYEVEEDEE